MFTKSWDEKMVAAFYSTNNEHAVLTTYLPGSENYGVENQSGRAEVPHICNLQWCAPSPPLPSLASPPACPAAYAACMPGLSLVLPNTHHLCRVDAAAHHCLCLAATRRTQPC